MIPSIPHYTCPKIDKVKEFITDAEAYVEDNDFGSAKIEDLQALYDHVADGAHNIKSVLEEIRSANEDLRAIAQHYENHDAIVEDLQNQIEELKREIRLLT